MTNLDELFPETPERREIRMMLLEYARVRTAALDQGREEGATHALTQSLFTVLSARGLTLTQAQREVIEGCADSVQLTQWIARAATSHDVDTVLAAPSGE